MILKPTQRGLMAVHGLLKAEAIPAIITATIKW
jgi:hypothetical protein